MRVCMCMEYLCVAPAGEAAAAGAELGAAWPGSWGKARRETLGCRGNCVSCMYYLAPPKKLILKNVQS